MDLEQGKIITGTFLIDKITISGRVAEIELNDILIQDITEKVERIRGTTKIIGILKDNVDLFSKTYSVGEKVVCKGKIRKRRKFYCLDIIYISKNMLDPQVSTKFNSDIYIKRFYEIISDVSDKDYKKILDNCFNDDVKQLFFAYPAAKDNHHNYTYGLLQHSIEVTDVCLFLADYYKNVDRDLLACAGILHDIGKLKSYDVDDNVKKIVKTDWEKLLGHLSISALFVSRIIPEDVDETKAMLLYHLILSHHGELAYGSPIVCKTKEAYILNKADDISFTLNHVDSLSYNGLWSDESKILKKSWYRSVENV